MKTKIELKEFSWRRLEFYLTFGYMVDGEHINQGQPKGDFKIFTESFFIIILLKKAMKFCWKTIKKKNVIWTHVKIWIPLKNVCSYWLQLYIFILMLDCCFFTFSTFLSEKYVVVLCVCLCVCSCVYFGSVFTVFVRARKWTGKKLKRMVKWAENYIKHLHSSCALLLVRLEF